MNGWRALQYVPFVQPLFIPPIAQPVSVLSGPAPTAAPNTAINPDTGIAFEGRTRAHQALVDPILNQTLPTALLRENSMRSTREERYQPASRPAITKTLDLQWHRTGSNVRCSLWRADSGAKLQRSAERQWRLWTAVRFDSLPQWPHTIRKGRLPLRLLRAGKWYDQHYPNVLAGFASSHPPNGDIRESMSTLWYHDHRVDFTAQNVYKGLAGFYLLFNEFDTGDETTGFRLPSFPNFDIPMMFNDKNFDPTTAMLAFDLANRDGILGDKFLVNGKIQPFFEVKRRRYRFRWLNGGPSRFYRFYLTKSNLTNHPFWVISNDGNLLKNPVQTTTGLMIAVAERMDVIVDFSSFAPAASFTSKTVWSSAMAPGRQQHSAGRPGKQGARVPRRF